MSQINLVIDAINRLGGSGNLIDIYKTVNEIEATPEPSIRRTIYQHSSECDIYFIVPKNSSNQDIDNTVIDKKYIFKAFIDAI